MLLPSLIAIHVLGVVIWIGGVAFVTIIVFPMLIGMEGSLEKMILFQGIEHRFAKIAKISVAVVGISGAWMLQLTGEWKTLFSARGMGPTLMVIVWTFYVLVLIFEARLFKALFRGEAQQNTSKAFLRLSVFHWVVLVFSLLAIGVGVWTGHGGTLVR